jgi:hypothetical protein
MDVSYMLFLQGDGPKTTDPDPRGPDVETEDDDAVTERDPVPSPNPMKPVPATPDANPIDPRVGQPW